MIELPELRIRMIAFRQHDRVARIWREAEALAQAGARVEVFLLRRAGQPAIAQLTSGIRVVRPTSLRPDSRRPGQAVRGYAAFLGAVGRQRADVYHCLDGATLPLGVLLARRDRARLVYDAADYFADHLPASPSETLVGRLRRRYSTHYLWEMLLIKRAELHVTVSEGLARLLAARYRLPRKPVVVPNSSAYLRPTDRHRALLRAAVGADPADRLVVFLGSVHPQTSDALEGDRRRGLDALVEAVARLPRSRLVIIGSAPDEYQASVLERARHHGGPSRVSFLGPRPYPEYIELASGGDVGAYLTGARRQSASYTHTLPNRLFDLIMARLPLIVGSGTATATIVHDYEIGVVLDRVDPPAVAAAIEALTAPDAGTRFGENLERAARDLCWERQSERLLTTYSALCTRARVSTSS
jgi:glycosyltransferase involved in cell wall biosynthesis